MFETVESPKTGQPLRAAWATKMANRVNELCTAVSPGMLIRDGVGGFGSEPVPVSRRIPKSSSQDLPWTFSCTVSEDASGNETREGGWSNCRMQIGYDASFGDEDGSGRDQCKDGVYYAEVDLATSTWVMKCVESSDTNGRSSKSLVPDSDFANNKVNVFVGTVKDAVCTYSIGCIPVVYKYV